MVEEIPEDRLGEDAAAVVGRMRKLLHVCIALNTVADPDRLLRHIAETTMSVLRCEGASILLHDGDALTFAAATGPVGEQLIGTEVPVGESLAGTVYRENRVLLAVEADADLRRYRGTDDTTGFTTRVILGVPMRLDGQAVGVLQAVNPLPDGRASADRFDATDAEMLFVIAAQAAVALQHARHTAALQRAQAELESLARLKANFIAITSHELRTPLTAIQGFGAILAEEVRPDLVEAAGSVVSAGRRMRDLVETLDVMAGLDGRPGQHPPEALDLRALVCEAAEAAGRRVELHLPDTPVAIRGDARRLGLALGNLLGNADRFTPPHGRVGLHLAAAGGHAEIRVEDTGRGLAAHDLEHIFEPYVQVACPDRRDHEGLGVGLTVARGIAEQHGGTLAAESDGLEQGAAFSLRLPLTGPAGVDAR